MEKTKDLLLSITSCNEIQKGLKDVNHPCHKIINEQKEESRQIPEPWNGSLETAEVLFIGINPGLDLNEKDYPLISEDESKFYDYFSKRLEKDKFDLKKYRYWYFINKWMNYFNDTDNEYLLDKCCITEVVHCKSKNSKNINSDCTHLCMKWTMEIIKLFKGKYIVVIGDKAKEAFESNNNSKIFNGKVISYLPHPCGGYKKGMTKEFIKLQIEMAKELAK